MRTREQSVRAAQGIQGWMHPAELEWLYDRASSSPVVVEIGVWLGRSTTVLCDACPGVVIAIDHFGGGMDDEPASPAAARELDVRNKARANLKPYLDSGKLLLVEADSASARQALAGLFSAPFVDMLFIDGDHRSAAVRSDLQFADFVKPGGIVSGHDWDWESVREVVQRAYPQTQLEQRIWWWRKPK